MDDAVNRGSGDTVRLGNLAEALPMLTIAKYGFAVEIERPAADVAAFEACAPHSRANAFDDQVAFQLGDGADDHDDGSAQRSSGIDALPEADELVVLRLAGQHITSRSDAEAVASGERCA